MVYRPRRKYKRGGRYVRKRRSVGMRRRRTRRSYSAFGRYRRSSTINSGFPKAYKTKLKYAVTFDGRTDDPGDLIFRGNGPYDPYQPTGGAQPAGWDTFATIYGRYHCSGSKIQIRVRNRDTQECFVALKAQHDDNTLAGETLPDLWINPNTVVKHLASNQAAEATTNVKHFSMYRSTKTFWKHSLEGTYAGVGANPANEWFWHIVVDGSVLYDLDVKITYYVTFHQPKLYDMD